MIINIISLVCVIVLLFTTISGSCILLYSKKYYSLYLLLLLLFNYYYSITTTSYLQNNPTNNMNDNCSFCLKCNKTRPFKTHHCSICKKCILNMDHHCPWILNWYLQLTSVGLNNHRYFILFLLYTFLLCLVFVCELRPSSFKSLWFYSLFSCLYLIALICGFLVFLLLCWNLYLVGLNETALEYSEKWRFDLKISHYKTFFNTSHSPWWYILLPIKVPPEDQGSFLPV